MNDFPLSESDIFCVKLMIAIAILGELRIAELHVDLFLYGPLLPKLLKFGKNYQNPSNQNTKIVRPLVLLLMISLLLSKLASLGMLQIF